MKKANKKTETFVYKGLGIPVKLVNAPMKKILGEWILDIDMNKLQLTVLRALIYKPTPLTGKELNFLRTYLDMTTTDFGEIFGVTHVAVINWEKEKRNLSPALELCIRLYILDHLEARDKEFRNFYNKLSLKVFSKQEKIKPLPLIVDAGHDLKIVL